MTKVVVERFSAGSVVADVTLVYDDVYYEDILLVEEALHVNKSFNGLEVEGITINSTSGIFNCKHNRNACNPVCFLFDVVCAHIIVLDSNVLF